MNINPDVETQAPPVELDQIPPHKLPAIILPGGILQCPTCRREFDRPTAYGRHRIVHTPGGAPKNKKRAGVRPGPKPKTESLPAPEQAKKMVATIELHSCPRCGLNLAALKAAMETLAEKGMI